MKQNYTMAIAQLEVLAGKDDRIAAAIKSIDGWLERDVGEMYRLGFLAARLGDLSPKQPNSCEKALLFWWQCNEKGERNALAIHLAASIANRPRSERYWIDAFADSINSDRHFAI